MDIMAEKSLFTLLKELRTLIDKYLKRKLNLGDFTMPQTMIIFYLAQSGKMKISELSEKMGLTNSTVSGIVDRLEDQGVVSRIRGTSDRRVVYVELTPEHQTKFRDIHGNLDKYFEEILAAIPPEEVITIYKSLTVLKNTISDHLDSSSQQ
ncbi:MAG: MarR family winged helix-turn-helix transcriptional regulator [Desulfitobacteriia bacterium]|jgi:DNA-binding MarR family transcriptional regulator